MLQFLMFKPSPRAIGQGVDAPFLFFYTGVESDGVCEKAWVALSLFDPQNMADIWI